jgi:hypothetical protein
MQGTAVEQEVDRDDVPISIGNMSATSSAQCVWWLAGAVRAAASYQGQGQDHTIQHQQQQHYHHAMPYHKIIGSASWQGQVHTGYSS